LATPPKAASAGPRLEGADVRVFPNPVYAGDELSFDVRPTLPFSLDGHALTITLAVAPGAVITAPVAPTGLDGVPGARFYWVAPASRAPLTLTLLLPPDVPDPDPTDNTYTVDVQLRPLAALFPPEPEARWLVTETEGVRLHYLAHTAAARDRAWLVAQAADAYAEVAARLGPASEPVDFYLLDRVIGQGGYASWAWVAVTYTDRDYAPVSLASVLRHELVHRLDDAVGCDAAPALLREGLAVYVAGGHYRPEPLARKAAALLASGQDVALAQLAEDFYTHQHEVGYLQAGALIAYVVERWGWEQVAPLCRAASRAEGRASERLAQGIAALGLDLPAFEDAWRAWLRAQPVAPADVAALEAEVRLMDVMRAYQQAYNPSAHFLEGILFSPEEAERRGIVADFVRRPRDAQAVTLELLLALGQSAVAEGDRARVEAVVAEVTAALEGGGFEAGMRADLLPIVDRLLGRGYEPTQVAVVTPGVYRVEALDYTAWPQAREFVATWAGETWDVRPVAVD
jgi:hypothetical protein